MTVKNKKKVVKFFRKIANLLTIIAGAIAAIWLFACGMRTDHDLRVFNITLIATVSLVFLAIIIGTKADSLETKIRRDRKANAAKEWWKRI